MKIVKINTQNPEKEKLDQALKILENEGVIVYPTDTIYGLGVNIYSEKAIERVYSIKGRDKGKPISVCLSKIEDIEKIAHLGSAKNFIGKNLPGSFTIILYKKQGISPILSAGSEKIGIRIPDNNICRELTRKFPITSTSANLSGESVPSSADDVAEKLGEQVDIIIDGGMTSKTPSTVIDFTISPPEILRKGKTNFNL